MLSGALPAESPLSIAPVSGCRDRMEASLSAVATRRNPGASDLIVFLAATTDRADMPGPCTAAGQNRLLEQRVGEEVPVKLAVAEMVRRFQEHPDLRHLVDQQLQFLMERLVVERGVIGQVDPALAKDIEWTVTILLTVQKRVEFLNVSQGVAIVIVDSHGFYLHAEVPSALELSQLFYPWWNVGGVEGDGPPPDKRHTRKLTSGRGTAGGGSLSFPLQCTSHCVPERNP